MKTRDLFTDILKGKKISVSQKRKVANSNYKHTTKNICFPSSHSLAGELQGSVLEYGVMGRGRGRGSGDLSRNIDDSISSPPHYYCPPPHLYLAPSPSLFPPSLPTTPPTSTFPHYFHLPPLLPPFPHYSHISPPHPGATPALISLPLQEIGTPPKQCGERRIHNECFLKSSFCRVYRSDFLPFWGVRDSRLITLIH